MFYSKLTGGFYSAQIHGSNMPVDAVEISAERHAELIEGQSDGSEIVADADGFPMLRGLPALTLGQLKVILVTQVDDFISAIYSKFTRFEAEYLKREAAARIFLAAGYSGDAGVWVSAFAASVGMSQQQAADVIISQADAQRVVLEQLGALRMRKYGINRADTAEAAQALHDDIAEQAAVIAATL